MIVKSIFSKKYTVFLDVLIQARKSQCLSQQVIATRLGKPQSFISKYENGERRLDVIEFFAIAKALEKDPVQLLKECGLL
ncbi:helix-turn-helix transcriptional regulator [Desulfovibrio sp. PG-178-WT-4]|uniref:Helix-turn-helix transcriptional regulator n=1 Tax=Desulfovibrio porci TaxID=2605782 RepID=A0A6L5XKR2_9BACT|nr:helix-turn-helix transcriptional regulator [Desulfovibrio porci]MDY3810359.1 helix-turn-helix transcriptional regulator [Desulfovibrio porci]MSS27774.1 helix-turn-helix transcriptional regulator [Desulfovibrio porci]